jgi:gluconate 2-dehydrogenase gamma chain
LVDQRFECGASGLFGGDRRSVEATRSGGAAVPAHREVATVDDTPILTRRELLKRVTLVGTAVAIPVRLVTIESTPAGVAALQGSAGVATAFETLTAIEGETLEATVARLIPTDGNGPGAAEALAAQYIDRALGGALAGSRDAYRRGLAALDGYARASRNAPFAQLSGANQDAVLREVETGTAAGFAGSAMFFNLLLAHTIQGTFGDPFYGGNANFVGWDLIGYPGVRLAVAPADQRLDARPAPARQSAYDLTMFSKKKPARARLGGDDHDHAG